MERMTSGLAQRMFALPWLTVPPIGFAELTRLVSKPSATAATALERQRTRHRGPA
jgi:arsenite-transporting ATPase